MNAVENDVRVLVGKELAAANERLCLKASQETRQIVQAMCKLAEEATPELHGLLVPLCEYCGDVCHEMEPCGRSHKK